MLVQCVFVVLFFAFSISANPISRDTVSLIDSRQHLIGRQLPSDQTFSQYNESPFIAEISPEDPSASAVGDYKINNLSSESEPLDSQDLSIIADLDDNLADPVDLERSLVGSQDPTLIANSDMIADCGSENSYNGKRSLLSLDPQRACPSNGIPWKKLIPGRKQKSEAVQQPNPQTSPPKIDPEHEHCDQRPSVTIGLPTLSILVSCGGPIVGLQRDRPSYVLNCMRGREVFPSSGQQHRADITEQAYTMRFQTAFRLMRFTIRKSFVAPSLPIR